MSDVVAASRPATAVPQAAPGLSSEQARRELERVGPNVLAAAEGPHWLARFGRNFTHLFALLLWAGAALALLGGQPPLAIAIVAVIVVNAIFSFAQEYRAERAVEALRGILPQRVRVRRDGRPSEITAEELVPGDVMLLAAGDRISADGRLLVEVELKVDMSTLTGESRPVRRRVSAGTHEPGGIEAPDRVFAGTHVVAGTAEATVTETAMATELGRIARLTQEAERHLSPLELEMARMTRLVAVLSVSVGGAFFVLAGFLGMGVSDRFVFAIGVIVANVPEGLLPTVTLSLAIATQRMARRNAIVRRLSSVETLGATTVICTDKTGTLTANEMTVRRVWTLGGELDVDGAGYAPTGDVQLAARARRCPRPRGARAGRRALQRRNARAGRRRAGRSSAIRPRGRSSTLAHKVGLDPATEAHRYPRRGEVAVRLRAQAHDHAARRRQAG